MAATAAGALTVDKATILAEHNKYRAAVGVPPLTWSDKLAEGAQRWANTIAALDRLQHSKTSGVGENLAFLSTSHANLPDMIGLWGREKAYFQQGTFPNVSNDGNWLDVAHYTQMVWRRTTQVGCGIGNNGKKTFWSAGTARRETILGRCHTEGMVGERGFEPPAPSSRS